MSTEQHTNSDHDEHHQQPAQDQDQSTEPRNTPRHHDLMGRRDAAAGTPPQRAADGPDAPAAGQRQVAVAGHLVQVETQPVEMADLGRDDWFIGPSGALYEVARPAGEHPSGWTDVTNLSMSEAAEQAARQRGDAEPGMSPRDGFFAYSVPVTVDRVIGVAEQAPVDDAHAALLGALTERWVSARDAAVDAVVARAGEATRSMISRRSPVAEIADARESRDTSDRDDARER